MHPRPHSTLALRATTPRKGLCHTRYAHTTHPRPHSTRVLRATTPRKGLCHTRHARATHPRPHSTLAPASFLRRKREPHNNQNITYYNITCNVYPNQSKDYTKKRGNLFLYRLNLLSLHDESWTTDSHCQNMHKQRFIRHQIFWHQHPCQSVGNNKRQVQLNRKSSWV